MSRNLIVVLIDHRHKFLGLIYKYTYLLMLKISSLCGCMGGWVAGRLDGWMDG
jgi:hypothetical protein